jgi:hypothetical protein
MKINKFSMMDIKTLSFLALSLLAQSCSTFSILNSKKANHYDNELKKCMEESHTSHIEKSMVTHNEIIRENKATLAESLEEAQTHTDTTLAVARFNRLDTLPYLKHKQFLDDWHASLKQT